MPDPAQYNVRRSILEAERSWSVDDTGLTWTGPRHSGHIPFARISEIRLKWAGSRADQARYACYVTPAGGEAEIIVSTHYAGPMLFPDRRGSYVPFIRELIRRTAAANPACRFRAGPTALAYAASVAAMLFGLGLTIGIALPWLIVVKLIILAALVPLAIRWLKVNRPRPFDPAVIPAGILPALH
jgi:hypothetical protein